MNDEMKEPDEEKALSESDERKPDFKAEQFSDGASDTSSSEIPPSNEDDGARKNEENDSLLTRAIHKLGNKNERQSQLPWQLASSSVCPCCFLNCFALTSYGPMQPVHALAHVKVAAKPRGNRVDTNGKKQRARFRRPVYAAVKPRGTPWASTGLVDYRSRLRRRHLKGNTRMREMRRGR